MSRASDAVMSSRLTCGAKVTFAEVMLLEVMVMLGKMRLGSMELGMAKIAVRLLNAQILPHVLMDQTRITVEHLISRHFYV